MKTIEIIQKEMDEILGKRSEKKKKSSEYKNLQKRYKLLKECKNYLYTEPRPEFIESSYNAVKYRIDVINNRFYEWIKYSNQKLKILKASGTL